MCGILGEVSTEGRLSSEVEFKALLAKSKLRGPNQVGYWTDSRQIHLGFNRLAILDTSINGNQPVISPNGRFVLVFNGEIYNYKELQKTYGIPDHALRSGADSEILAHLCERLPARKIAEQLNGMFAIAIADTKVKTLYLFRDFAGIKPLFYGIQSDTLVLASQFDQVFLHPKFRPHLQLRPEIMREYLGMGYLQAPNTAFKDIYQCNPGELITYDAHSGQLTREQFCTFAANPESILTEEDSVEALGHCMEEVVKDQMVSDVPLASFLSGGIDSPLICAYASHVNPGIKAFTIGLEEAELDEGPMARRYAQYLGIPHHLITFSKGEILNILDEHFRAFSEPFGDYSSLPTFLVTKIARQHATVMLSGDGGDELFWGYPRYLNLARHLPWFQWPRSVRRGASYLGRKAGKKISYGVSAHTEIGAWARDQQLHNRDNILQTLLLENDSSNETNELYRYSEGKDRTAFLKWFRWNEFYGHLQRVLIKVDRASMGNSLEVRVPFLDKRIIELAWQLEPGLGKSHQELKYVLKKLMARHFSSGLVNHKKMGFTIPIGQWMRYEIREEIEGVLLDGPIFGHEYFYPGAIEPFIMDFSRKGIGNPWGIWILYAWQKWAKQYQLS